MRAGAERVMHNTIRTAVRPFAIYTRGQEIIASAEPSAHAGVPFYEAMVAVSLLSQNRRH